MRNIEKYYILQDSKTQQYLCIDSASGGYPYFSDNYRSVEKFKDESAIHTFYNGGKLNGAYKRMFPEHCENLIPKLVTITVEL